MCATLTPSDKKTIIALFVILTIATIIDIGQDFSNHQEADKDREQMTELIERNNNVTDQVIIKLNDSSNKTIEFIKVHEKIMHDLETHMNETRTVYNNGNNITK